MEADGPSRDGHRRHASGLGLQPFQLGGNGQESLLRLTAISKSFGPTIALDDVSMEVRSGEIRGLIGRNGAGKSTLVRIACGDLTPDRGQIIIYDEDATKSTGTDRRKNVGMVYQHSALVETLTVTENLFLGRFPTGRGGFLSWARLHEQAEKILQDWGLTLDVERPIQFLTLADRQVVEIARELARGARIIILDEPTSRLPQREIAELHSHVRKLRDAEAAIVYISHHLQEVINLCDSVTVLRDGRHVATRTVSETTEQELVSDMVGEFKMASKLSRTTASQKPTSEKASSSVALRVQDMHVGEIGPLSFEVRRGELVGLAGLIGSGKESVGAALSGYLPIRGGKVEVRGEIVHLGSVVAAIRAGIGHVPPDRHERGLVLPMDVSENITMSIWPELSSPGGFFSRRLLHEAKRLMAAGGVVAASAEQPVEALSGGNQQKVTAMRGLACDPEVLVLMNPTTGIDVASKDDIYELIDEQRRSGKGIVLITDEIDEYRLCDRIYVMFQGRMTAVVDGSIGEHELVAAMEGVDRSDLVENH